MRDRTIDRNIANTELRIQAPNEVSSSPHHPRGQDLNNLLHQLDANS
jgi:hypothetical protein